MPKTIYGILETVQNQTQIGKPIYDYKETGIYTVTLFAQSECGADTISQDLEVLYVSFIPDEPFKASMSIYPNPVSGVLFVEVNKPVGADVHQLTLFDIQGRIVRQQSFNDTNGTSYQMELSDLPEGIYILQLRNEKGDWSLMEKIIKQ